VLGLLADLPRKNCWTIAEHAGDITPDGMQHPDREACAERHRLVVSTSTALVEALSSS
jgi:hypothetical protein